MFLITLAYPFHSELLFEFFCKYYYKLWMHNHAIMSLWERNIHHGCWFPWLYSHSNTSLSAHPIINDPAYNWYTINTIIRNSPLYQHQPLISGLMLNTCVIQHMLRNNVISKLVVSLTSLLSYPSLPTFVWPTLYSM